MRKKIRRLIFLIVFIAVLIVSIGNIKKSVKSFGGSFKQYLSTHTAEEIFENVRSKLTSTREKIDQKVEDFMDSEDSEGIDFDLSNFGDETDEADEGQSPEPETSNTSPSAISLIPAELIKVVDGDTIWARVGGEKKKIRFIGVNTEESVSSDKSKNNIYGEYASDYLKQLLADISDLFLEYDEGQQDKYGRELCYVWLSQDTSDIRNMLNAKLIADGYAYTMTVSPNTKYVTSLQNLQAEAERYNEGLWQYEEFTTIAKGR